jgi:DNA-binding Lrp family transcriptional regulator
VEGLFLNENQLKVLKFMAEVTGRIDMNEFARRVSLTPSQAGEQIQELAKAGLVSKVGGGYGITEQGKTALKAFSAVPVEKEFHFYTAMNQPTGLSAKSFKEFYDLVKTADVKALEFHLYRGDFENWVRTTVNDAVFANELECMTKSGVKSEQLRETLLRAAESRFSLQP